VTRIAILVAGMVALAGCGERPAESTARDGGSPSFRVDLWATDHALDPGQDLSIVRELHLPAGYHADLIPLAALLEPWGLQASGVRVQETADGGTVQRQSWSGAVRGQGVLRVPAEERRVEGPMGTHVLRQPELLIRVGPDPEGPLPPPAPAELSVLPPPEALPPKPAGRAWLLWCVGGLFLALLLLLGWMRRNAAEEPAPADPVDALRGGLHGAHSLADARALLGAYLVDHGGLAPGLREAEPMRRAARRAALPAEAVVDWFARGEAALFSGQPGDELVQELRQLLATKASP
jgi:hypothetical protein